MALACGVVLDHCDLNVQGTLRNLGGLMIMKPGAQGVAYRRPEKWMGDFPSNAEVANLLSGCIFRFASILSCRAHADE